MRQRIIHEIGSGETYLENDNGTKERIPCFNIKVRFDKSEFNAYYWPKKKSDRKKAHEHFKETGEMLELND